MQVGDLVRFKFEDTPIEAERFRQPELQIGVVTALRRYNPVDSARQAEVLWAKEGIMKIRERVLEVINESR